MRTKGWIAGRHACLWAAVVGGSVACAAEPPGSGFGGGMMSGGPGSGGADAGPGGGMEGAGSNSGGATAGTGGTGAEAGSNTMPAGPKFDIAGGDLPSDTMTCADVSVEIAPATVRIMLLVDRSDSMRAAYETSPSRWNALRDVLFTGPSPVVPANQDEIEFGLTLYGNARADLGLPCPLLTVLDPTPDTPDAQADFLDFEFPDTNSGLGQEVFTPDTPTGESIRQVTADLLALNDGSAKAIVLATDGVPDTCLARNEDPAGSMALAVAETRNAYAAGIKTFVIGLGDQTEQIHLQDMANAGVGNDGFDFTNQAPFFSADNPDELATAFQSVITGFVPCDFTMNGAVEVAEACRGTVLLDGVERECGVDWELSDPQTLRLTGDACEALQDQSLNHDLAATFPCAIINVG